MDKQPDTRFALGSNCTDIDCKSIPNSDCYVGQCKCKIGFGPSTDRRACRKSKKIGQPCHPIHDTCFQDKLQCDELSNVCQCAPGYRFDSSKNDCFWVYWCEDNLIYDSVRRQCIKPSDFWFPTSNHNPKLSFITFILLVFCFIKVMRSNSPYRERRRRISTSLNRNSFDLLSTIVNYENNQRYPIRQPADRNGSRAHRRDPEGAEFYEENLPPPAYEDIIREDDLKTVTVERQTVGEETPGDFELKELGQDGRRKLSNGETLGSSDTSLENGSSTTESNGLPNGPPNGNMINGPNQSSDSSTGQPADSGRSNQLSNQPSNQQSNQQFNQQPNNSPDLQQPSNQLNHQLSNEILPTYDEAVRNSRNPAV